jgi:hypothetical protein
MNTEGDASTISFVHEKYSSSQNNQIIRYKGSSTNVSKDEGNSILSSKTKSRSSFTHHIGKLVALIFNIFCQIIHKYPGTVRMKCNTLDSNDGDYKGCVS